MNINQPHISLDYNPFKVALTRILIYDMNLYLELISYTKVINFISLFFEYPNDNLFTKYIQKNGSFFEYLEDNVYYEKNIPIEEIIEVCFAIIYATERYMNEFKITIEIDSKNEKNNIEDIILKPFFKHSQLHDLYNLSRGIDIF